MEVNVVVTMKCTSKQQRDFIALMLGDRLDKPIVEDDVPEENRDWFRVLDEVEPTDWTRRSGDRGIHLAYMIGGYTWDEQLKDIVMMLAQMNAERVAALTKTDFGDMEIWLLENREVGRYDDWQGLPINAVLRGKRNKVKALDELLDTSATKQV